MKSGGPEEDNHDLNPGCYTDDANERYVAMDIFEDIQVIVETTAVQCIENLHPEERIEYDGVQLSFQSEIRRIMSENERSVEVEYQRDSKLINGLANNHLPHLPTKSC